MYGSMNAGDLFAEVDRLQRELRHSFDGLSPSIRGIARGFPALNVGSTQEAVEIYAFAPGIDPSRIEVHLERGVLTIEGERGPKLPPPQGKRTVHIDERFEGRFHRVVGLPDDVDPASVKATYRDGVLQVSIQRREAAKPRRVEVQ